MDLSECDRDHREKLEALSHKCASFVQHSDFMGGNARGWIRSEFDRIDGNPAAMRPAQVVRIWDAVGGEDVEFRAFEVRTPRADLVLEIAEQFALLAAICFGPRAVCRDLDLEWESVDQRVLGAALGGASGGREWVIEVWGLERLNWMIEGAIETLEAEYGVAPSKLVSDGGSPNDTRSHEDQVRDVIQNEIRSGSPVTSITRDLIAKKSGLSGGTVSGTEAWRRLAGLKRAEAKPRSRNAQFDEVADKKDWNQVKKMQQEDENSRFC